MRTLGIIGLSFIILILVLGIIVYFKVMAIKDNINIEFIKAFKGINLGSFSIDQLVSSGQTKINPTLGIIISNNSTTPIPFKEMKASIYHDGTLIADISETLTAKEFILPPQVIDSNGNITGGILQISDTINVYLNKTGGQLLLDKLKGGHPELNYVIKVKIKLFGMWIPVSYEDKFTW